MGRPTIYSPELTALLCERLIGGNSLRTACAAEDMPCAATVFLWLHRYPAFLEQYEIATVARAHAHAEEMLDIADDGTNDWMEDHDKEGNSVGWKLNGENIQRSRLRIDTRKWNAARMSPKRYGDKVDLNHSGSAGLFKTFADAVNGAES